MHCGEEDEAQSLARRNLKAFPSDVDAIITNAAGCGSGIKEYPLLFKGSAEEGLAESFASKVQDITEFLDQLQVQPPPLFSTPLRVAYHDACHLRNAQGISAAPRRLLGDIPNLTLLEIPEGNLCCGSAGTYSLEQPSIASTLGAAKASNILQTKPDVIVAGNIGCIVQIRKSLDKLRKSLPVLHTVEILDAAYAGAVLQQK